MPTGPDTGPFLGFLDWVNGAGEIPLNLIRRRPGAAGRKLLDTITGIPDALLPGDWIPEASTDEDSVTASEAFNIDPMEHPLGAKLTDIVGGTVLNPVTWSGIKGGVPRVGLPFRANTPIPGASEAISRVKGLAGQAWDKVPEKVREPLARSTRATGDWARRTFNYLDVRPEDDAVLESAASAGRWASQAGTARLEQIYKGMTTPELEATGQIVERLSKGDRGWMEMGDPDAFLASLPDVRPDVVKKAVADHVDLMGTYSKESAEGGIIPKGSAVNDPSYLRRLFSGEYFKDVSDPLSFNKPGAGGVLKPRVEELETPEGLAGFLNRNPDAKLNLNAMEADLARTQSQGRLATKASLGRQIAQKGIDAEVAGLQKKMAETTDPAARKILQKEIDGLDGGFALSNEKHRPFVDKAIAAIEQSGQRDYAYKLRNMWTGTAPRSEHWFAKGLHGTNKLFKSAATFGVLFPRIAFNVGNRLSGLAGQIPATSARGTFLESAKRVPGDLAGAAKDGLIALRESLEAFDNDFTKAIGGVLPKGGERTTELSRAIEAVESALAQSGGSAKTARELLGNAENGEYLVAAMDHGVLNNFVRAEELLARMSGNDAWRKTKDVLMWPAHIAQGVEQRMRLGTFMDLLKSKVPAGEAGRTIKDTFLDYDVPGIENRTFRDLIPFGAFLTQNIKQQAKFIAEKPGVAVAAGQLFGNDDEMPKYPWLDQQLSVPIGLDEKGNPQYISSFRMPIEGLAEVPGTGGADLWSDIVGNMNPLLKSGLAYAANRDPFTGGDFGYDKIMGEPMGAAGRAYNVVMGTGLTQAVGTPLKTVENLLDDRKSPLERAGQFLTGVRTVSVDPDTAKKQRIEQFLEQHPEVKQYSDYFIPKGQEADPGLSDLMKELEAAKGRLKEKREAAKAQASL